MKAVPVFYDIMKKSGDGMLYEEKFKIARKNFALASEEFGFEFQSPFSLLNEIEVFGYIPNYGSKNGVVICFVTPPDFATDRRVVAWCKEMDCFYAFLNIELFIGEYKRSIFREMLRDWGEY